MIKTWKEIMKWSLQMREEKLTRTVRIKLEEDKKILTGAD